MQRVNHLPRRVISIVLTIVMVASLFSGILPGLGVTAKAAANEIANDSLKISVGDLGQISTLNIVNNPRNRSNREINFVLPNDTRPQNGVQHQWMGEMIFSVRSSADGSFPADNTGFVEVDTNKTLAAGGSTTASNIASDNPYIEKTVVSDKKVEVNFIGQDLSSTTDRTMKGFDVKSTYDMDTEDGSLLWTITLKNKSDAYLEFGDVGLPMPWNNKYTNQNSVYSERVTAHTFAGADSGYAYAIRCSGEGNYILFTPVATSGARIEYVDNWIGSNNGVSDNRTGSTFSNWTGDSGGWQPGLSVYYIHSKDIHKTGRSYFEDATSLILEPGESQTYQFKFSAVRAGDNTPQESAESPNNASDSIEQRETNMRSILYQNGLIDAIAVPGFQTALNMDTRLDLHYDDSLIKVDSVDIQCVHENDPFDEAHTPEHRSGMVNNSRTGRGLHDRNEGYEESVSFVETKTVDGEQHHIYDLHFGCIGNNSVRVEYKLKVGDEWVSKFTQFEFNVLTELDQASDTHADFMVNETQDTNPDSPTYGIYSDWYFASGRDSNQRNHWGDDWSHDNINFIAMKNYLNPDAEQVKSIETYLIDFMWNTYMKNTQDNFIVANYLSASGAYSTSSGPYTRTFSEVMEATGFFNMYRIVKAYPDLIEYRKPAAWYLEKAYGIYSNRVGTGAIGFYGEQQIPDMIEALYAEGMDEEAFNLQERFAWYKANNCINATYPYGSEFAYDNTGEEGAFAAIQALTKYWPDSDAAKNAYSAMSMANHKTRAMRGIQPTWYQYADPVFIGGESWWNFQYTASLAGSIMDDWMRYEELEDGDTTAWAARVNYAAKISNFNAINMGQISDKYVGNVSWRYNMYKGGYGAMNVNDGGTRVMNNGWQDFSGESDEGLYGSLLRISADVVNDPIFGLYGYGANVTADETSYTVIPTDGFGKRVNILDQKIYVETTQDTITSAKFAMDGSSIELNVKGYTAASHVSHIALSGAGLKDGFYAVNVNGEKVSQVYVKNNEANATITMPAGETNVVTITADPNGENAAPQAAIKVSSEDLHAIVTYTLSAIASDDGYPGDSLTYLWAFESLAGEGASAFLSSDAAPTTQFNVSEAGEYVISLTVSDGEKSTKVEKTLVVGEAPERLAPTIDSATGTPVVGNPTVADLKAEATVDPLYQGVPRFHWELVSQPEGGNAMIGNPNEKEAKLRVDKGGEYVVRLTVTDEDKTSSTEVTVTMTDAADGIQRVKTVITQVGVAPTLPNGVVAVRDDGTYSGGAVDWDEISEDKYAQAGEFEAYGTLRTQTTRVAVKVIVVKGDRKNVALFATPTAIINTPSDLGGVAGLNDGFDPSSSRDTSHGVWHNWQGAQGDAAWVMYTWDVPVTIDGADAYYFTDGNFAPKDAKLEYLAEDGQWHEVPNVSGLGIELNQYNTTSFDPITTTKLRMTMNPKTLGIGVIEWKVYGYGEFVDRSALKSAIATAKGINTNLFVEGSKYLLDLAIAKAQAVLSDTAATQEQVDAAAAELNAVIAGLESADGNLAYSASVTTSFCSSWESVSAVNDGIVRSNSYDPSKPRYGTWGNTSSYETVTYTWGSEVIIDSTDLYLWYDGTEGEYTSGGILVPKSVEFDYLDAEGNWKPVTNGEGFGREMDKFNKTTFDPVTTTALRVKLNKQSRDYNGVGIMEWKVYGKLAKSDGIPTAVKVVIARIDAIGEVTLDSKDAIEAARAAYDALPTRLQPEVSNYDKLVKAEKDYTDLLTAVEAAQKAAEDARKAFENAKAAQEKAEAAKAAAEAAQKAAEEAAQASGENSEAAKKAQAAAEEAQEKAEAAKAAAETAQAGAEAAQKAAEDAAAAAAANNALAAEAAAKAAEKAAKSAEEAGKAAASAEAAAKSAADAAEAMLKAQKAQKAAEDAEKAAEEAEKKAEEARKKAEEAAASTAEDREAAEKAAEEAKAAQKAAEDARKSAEDAKSAAELAMQAAEQSNKEAAASAAQAAEYAKKMAEAYEEIVRIKAELVEYLAKAQAEAERAEAERKAAEEAQRKAEEAALAAAKYAAAYELAQLQQNGEGLTGHAKEAYDKALADAAAAIEAAKTPAEVDAALAAAREALNNALCPSAAFTDVEENVWYHDGIDFMVRNGYMNGVAADTFDVEGSLTRAQLVTILYRIAGEPETSAAIPFADVADGQWYTKAIVWAAENGIVKGVNETTFAPNDPITREQIAVILYRYAHEENTEDGKLTSFPDAKDISGYALEAMNWAVARGLINGSDGKLLPQDTATRAQIAVILARYLNA